MSVNIPVESAFFTIVLPSSLIHSAVFSCPINYTIFITKSHGNVVKQNDV